VSRDKHEEAIRVLATYHGDGDRNAPLVQLEYREMVEDISNTGADKRWWDYRELFNSRETRYRSMLVILMGNPRPSQSMSFMSFHVNSCQFRQTERY
jgi:hypothetical protein